MHPHLRTLYADRFFVFVGVQCVLSAGQDGIGRQSLQVWTCWRAVVVHSYPSMSHSFICGIWAVDIRSNERVLTFVEDLQSSACLWNVHCGDYKNRNKIGNATDILAKIWSHYYWSWEKNRHWLNIGALRLMWPREGLLRQVLYLSFEFC